MKPKDLFIKKWWAVPVLVNVAALCLSAVLFVIYLILNWEYIINPESSPGYNCGAPFGDGYDKFFFGIVATRAMIFWLAIFNIVQTVIILRKSSLSQKKILYVFAVIALIESLSLGRISSAASFIICSSLYMIFSESILMYIIPFSLFIVSAILVFIKKRIALPFCFYAITVTASVWLEFFSIYLYLD